MGRNAVSRVGMESCTLGVLLKLPGWLTETMDRSDLERFGEEIITAIHSPGARWSEEAVKLNHWKGPGGKPWGIPILRGIGR